MDSMGMKGTIASHIISLTGGPSNDGLAGRRLTTIMLLLRTQYRFVF